MVDPLTLRRWLYRALFVALATVLLLIQVLPVTVEAGRWPGPDLILAMAMAWGFRRPDYVPPLVIGAVFLMADLMLQRPPGLFAALVILALEVLRNRNALWRDLPFMAEWGIISIITAAVVVLNWLVLAALLVGQAALGLHLIQLAATLVAYPFVVAVSALLFGVRRIAPGELEAFGVRT